MNLALYHLVEAVIGREVTGRVGRWLYQGSRRELKNDPVVNGEYLLQRAWVKARLKADRPLRIVDVGANIGDWTTSMVAELGAAGCENYAIWAFEPAPHQRAEMQSRLRDAVRVGNLHIDDRAVGAVVGQANFSVTGDQTGTSSLAALGAESDYADVVVTTLDAAFGPAGAETLDFVKVDTEGNDFNVILGASSLFDAERIDILQFEYNWRWISFRHYLKDVFDFADGRPYAIGRVTRSGMEIYTEWHPELERFIETNYVLVHQRALDAVPHWRTSFSRFNIPAPHASVNDAAAPVAAG